MKALFNNFKKLPSIAITDVMLIHRFFRKRFFRLYYLQSLWISFQGQWF